MAGWYNPDLKPKRSRADRTRAARNYGSLGLRSRKPPRVRHPNVIFQKNYCLPVHLDGYTVKVTTKYRIAKFFDVPVITVSRWEKAGVLPEPFIVQERGSTDVNVYLASQVRCLIMVINDLVSHGYVTIPWGQLPEHATMLAEGYATALENFQRRSGDKYAGLPAERGVILYD